MPARQEELSHGSCSGCSRRFTYAARLPRQDICPECFYESRGDLSGARDEHIYRLGFDAGYARAEALHVEDAERMARAAA